MRSQREFERRLSSLAGMTWRGTFFRSIDAYWLLQGTPLSAIGSHAYGGRYNRKGAFEALYLADTPITALYETEAITKSAGVVAGNPQPPRALLSVHCDLHDVVDLRDPMTREALGVTTDDLAKPWKVAQALGRTICTQRIGAAARAVDIEALLVPSARVDEGTNLVLFPDRLRNGSSVDLVVGDRPTIERCLLEGRYASKTRD